MTADGITIHANAFVSRYHVRAEAKATFIDRFNALWQADIRGLEAATHFVFYGWGRDPNEFVAIESWKDDAVTDAIRETDLFKQAVAGLLACCDRPMEMQLYSGMAASRAIFDKFPLGPSQVHPRHGDIGALFV